MKVGRPSKDIYKRVTVGLDNETYLKISYFANKDGISVSEYIRKIIRKATR